MSAALELIIQIAVEVFGEVIAKGVVEGFNALFRGRRKKPS
jgi:hypothetical protein